MEPMTWTWSLLPMLESEFGARRDSRLPELLITQSASSDSSKTLCLFTEERLTEGTATWCSFNSGKMPSMSSQFSTMDSSVPFLEHSSMMVSCIKDLISFSLACQYAGTVLLISSTRKINCWAIQIIINLDLRISALTSMCFGSGIFMPSGKVGWSYSWVCILSRSQQVS